MKYQKPIARDLSNLAIAAGECSSGGVVDYCHVGTANATNLCETGEGVFSIEPSCSPTGNVADTCTNGTIAGP